MVSRSFPEDDCRSCRLSRRHHEAFGGAHARVCCPRCRAIRRACILAGIESPGATCSPCTGTRWKTTPGAFASRRPLPRARQPALLCPAAAGAFHVAALASSAIAAPAAPPHHHTPPPCIITKDTAVKLSYRVTDPATGKLLDTGHLAYLHGVTRTSSPRSRPPSRARPWACGQRGSGSGGRLWRATRAWCAPSPRASFRPA